MKIIRMLTGVVFAEQPNLHTTLKTRESALLLRKRTQPTLLNIPKTPKIIHYYIA